MDSIKAQIAALRQSCSKAAFAIEVASVTDSPLDKVINASTLRLMGECALILDGEIRQLTETGVSHFQLVLEQSHATVEKVARVLGPSIDRKKMVSLLKESPGGITEVRMDGALLNVLLLHLRVMVAVVGLPAGGKNATLCNGLLKDLVEETNTASRELVQKPSYLAFSQRGPPPSSSPPLISTLPSRLLSPPTRLYSSSETSETEGVVGAKKQDVRSSKRMHKWKFMSVLCGAPKGADFVVPTIPRPLFPENMVCTHVATLGGEPEFVIQLSTPPKPLVLHQLSNVSPLGPENITEEAAAKAVTTFFQYTMTPRGSWCIIDVTRENVKEEELRSRVNNAKDVQRTKSKLDQHKRSQVDQLIADLNGRESDRRFQWFPGAITREGKSLVVTVERGPKVGLQASAVYNAAMASPSSFLPGQSRVSLGSSRPEDSRVCFNNTEERSGYHIIILAYKDTLGWVETNNGPASG